MKRICTIAFLFVLAACQQSEQVSRPVSAFVRAIIANADSRAHRIVADAGAPVSTDDIYLVGSRRDCQLLGEALIRSDRFDNTDGQRGEDLLPDFAGETIVSIQDVANEPYDGYIEAGNYDFLRSIAVSHVVNALDTVCYISPYDREGLSRKNKAKLILFTSSVFAAYGQFEVDTLLHTLGCSTPVVFPLEDMLEEVFSAGKASCHIGVIADSLTAGSGAYSSLFRQKCQEHGIEDADCVCFPRRSDADPLTSFLDSYIAAGYSAPLDALIIDDYTADMDEVTASMERIRSVMSEESYNYGWLLRDDCRLLDVQTTAATRCYEFLRSHSLFTHRIALPRSQAFITCPRPNLPESTFADKFARSVSADIETFMLIPFSERYLPE
ncbi:MAG: hypothetical protein IJU63_07325 [Bacteroidales bacterium]|nr:hypothetical protein [Bacteroidales bacterium]MCR5277490.1 hypothetical protein [Bacteroidales bacterium]